MIQIDTKAYIFRMFVTLFYFYGSLFTLYHGILLRKKLIMLLLFLPITFFIGLFTDISDIFPIIACYLLVNGRKSINHQLINAILISMLIFYFVTILISAGIVQFIPFSSVQGWRYIFIEILIEMITLTGLLLLLRFFSIEKVLKKHSSAFSSLLLAYMFFVILMIGYAAHYYEAFDRFVSGIVIFLIVQSVFLIVLFVHETRKQKEQFEHRLMEQQLINLKKYADQLEENQQKIRKFQHDYKNLILSLKEFSGKEQDRVMRLQVNDLERYSEDYFSSISWSYNDLKNIQNTYLKSLLISKLFTIQENRISCSLEAKQEIKELPIPVFDYIRIIGITLDNAIEAASEVAQPKISIMFFQDAYQLECLIKNNFQDSTQTISELIKPGVTSKKDHKGLGLSNIQDLKKKYANLFVQYERDTASFVTQIITMFERK